jgi:hypothetical protein
MKYAFLFTLLALASLSRGDETVLISPDKFDGPTLSVYGTWLDAANGNIQLTKSAGGVEISGNATARGGVNKSQILKLSDGDTLSLELAPHAGNKAHALNVLLENADGAQVGWRFDISKLPQDKPTLLVATNLSNPDFVNKPGSNGKFDLQNVTGWHLQGDFSSDDPVKVSITRLSISSK